MDQPSATRSELLNRRAQLNLATQGRDLLKEKRDQLLDEFRATSDIVLEEGTSLEQTAAQSRATLNAAEIEEGPEAVRSASMATNRSIAVHAETATVMGVRIADIEAPPLGRPRTARGYSLAATSPRIDAVASSYENQLDLLLEVATLELKLRRLADEIGKAGRRVNALDVVVIPQFQRELRAITNALDERERQEQFRLKRIKQQRAAKEARESPPRGGPHEPI